MKQTYLSDTELRDETIALLAALLGTFAYFQERLFTLHAKINAQKKTEEGPQPAP